MKSYQALKEHIDIIHKADENYARHMWDEEKLDALNDFIEALADLATDVSSAFSMTRCLMKKRTALRGSRLKMI